MFDAVILMILPSMMVSGAAVPPDIGRNTSPGCDASAVGECNRELAEQVDDYPVFPEPEPEPDPYLEYNYYYYASYYVTYRALFRPPVCSEIKYASCISPVRPNRTRSCTAYERCRVQSAHETIPRITTTKQT